MEEVLMVIAFMRLKKIYTNWNKKLCLWKCITINLKGLWDEYSALEIASKAQDEQEQRRKLMQLLMGLHDSFATARGQILMMDPLPTVTHAYSLIRETCFKLNGYPKGHPLAIYNKPKPQFNNNPNASRNKKGNQFYQGAGHGLNNSSYQARIWNY